MNRPPAMALNCRLLRRVRVDAVDDEQDHRVLNRLSLKAPRNWVDEQRQEAPRAQQVGDVLHQGRSAGCSCGSWPHRHSQLCAALPNAITASAVAMLTLPNLLTLSRIFAVPILVFLLWRPTPVDYAITFVLYCIVGITDYFDGYLARAQGQISRLGQFLDPIADKIMVAAVIVMLMSSRKANRRCRRSTACTSSRR